MKRLFVHIGPPKTGTTAVQLAAKQARDLLVNRAGIDYITSAGDKEHALHATLDLIGSRTLNAQDLANMKESKGSWRRLKDSILKSQAESGFISSEALAAFNAEDIQQFKHELMPMAFHLIITTRSLLELIPSQWQQWVKGGEQEGLEQFVQRAIREYQSPANSYFWNVHNTAEVAQRWINGLQPDHVSLIVVNKRFPSETFRQFELVLGITEPILSRETSEHSNASLTLEEVTFIQLLRSAIQLDPGKKKRVYVPTNSRDDIANIKVRGESRKMLHKISVPDAYVSAVLEIQDDIMNKVASLGITVLGDPTALLAQPTLPASIIDATTFAALEAAAELSVVALRRQEKERRRDDKRSNGQMGGGIRSWVKPMLTNEMRTGGKE
jgi:hypothetical protein